MPNFGNMFASLTLESASFMSGLEAARKSLGHTQKTFAQLGAGMQKVGAVRTVGITAPFLAASTAATEGALAQRQAMAQVTASLESMGPAAGRTAQQLSAAADALEMHSLQDADVILKDVTANLLTYGNVTGQTFDRAQQAILDLSQKTGKGLLEATTMVGKALNDPAKGLAALSKVGIQFDESQKAAVKSMLATGNVAGAQAIILGELERQFRGSAQAAANTDPYRQMNVAFGQMSDVLGEVVLTVLPSVTSAIKGIADVFLALPAPVQTGMVAVIGISAALGPVIAAIGTFVSAIGAALPVMAALRVATMTQAIPAIVAFGATLGPVLLPIAAVTAAVAGVVAVVRNWDQIKPYVDKVVAWMGTLYTGVKTWVLDKLNAVWSSVQAGIDRVKGWFYGLYDAVVGHSYIPDMVDEIGQHMARLDETLVRPARAATQTAAEAFQALGQVVAPILERLFPDQARVNQFKADMEALLAYAKEAGWSIAQTEEAVRRLRNERDGKPVDYDPTKVEPDFGIPSAGEVVQEVGKTVEDAWDQVRAANDNTVESFAGMARDIVGSLGKLGREIKEGDWLSALQSVLDVIGQVAGAINRTGQAAQRTYPVGIDGARAMGGPVLPNRSYLVGERGPEILRMGGRGGAIVPNHQLGGQGAMTFDLRGAVMTADLLRQMNVIAAETGGSMIVANNRSSALRGRQALG